MSDSFFEFTITCPHCGHVSRSADGYETDDWTEVFVFSGYSRLSARGAYREYVCPACGRETRRDDLYAGKFIAPDSMDRIKAYFSRTLSYVLERGGIFDHGWDPDLETAVCRYADLYPDDPELRALRHLYNLAYHYPKQLTRCEPARGTRRTTPAMVLRPDCLRKIYLPDGLEEIGDGTFRDCGGLPDAFIPRTVSRIGASAFENCRGLATVRTPDQLREIGDRAFAGCGALGSIYLPGQLRAIGAEAFRGCRRLKKVFIPAGCAVIGRDAFADCPGLVICGAKGTAAESYALAGGFTFSPE